MKFPAKDQLSVLRRDLRETADFWRERTRRRQAAEELQERNSPRDLFQFTHERFVRPAAQNESEIVRFVDAVAPLSPRAVCEIGVQDGGTTFVLSRALPTVDMMIAIDLHVSLKCQLRYFRRPDLRLSLIDGSSLSPRTRRRVKRILGNQRLDILFIDGDHSYEGALQDFLTYRPFVRDGGVIAFHDIVPDSQTRHGIKTEAYVGDVPRLWADLSRHYGSREFIDDPGQDGRGIGMLVYDPSVALPELLP
jgi:cephalosporin hydroxylase